MCRYDTLITPSYIHVFQFLYFFSSFWNQMGPNCTTWLVAGEVYPTDVRAFFHGISAAFGKAGAIAATQIFSRISSQDTFIVSAISGIVGAVFTWFLLPDTTGERTLPPSQTHSAPVRPCIKQCQHASPHASAGTARHER